MIGYNRHLFTAQFNRTRRALGYFIDVKYDSASGNHCIKMAPNSNASYACFKYINALNQFIINHNLKITVSEPFDKYGCLADNKPIPAVRIDLIDNGSILGSFSPTAISIEPDRFYIKDAAMLCEAVTQVSNALEKRATNPVESNNYSCK